MEFMGKTRIETYHAKPVTDASPHFLRVYYGWWSFSFRLDDGEATAETRRSAEAQAHALLLLDDDDGDLLSWRSILKHHCSEARTQLLQSMLQKSSSKGKVTK